MHLYIGLEALNLIDSQRDTLLAHLRSLGPQSHAQPSHINHSRVNLAGDKAIVEADFDATTITVAAIKARLAAIYGVAVSLLTHTTVQTAFGPAITIRRGGVARLRFLVFGGVNADWATSGAACREYLKANQAEWEEVQP